MLASHHPQNTDERMTETSDTSSELKWTIHFAIVISYKRRCREVDSFAGMTIKEQTNAQRPTPNAQRANSEAVISTEVEKSLIISLPAFSDPARQTQHSAARKPKS